MKQIRKPYSLLCALALFLLFTSPAFAFFSKEKSPEEEASEKVKKATNEYNDGVKHMDKAREIALKGDSAFAYNYRATSDAKAKKEYEKAAKNFDKAIAYQPDMKEAFNNLGYCFRKLGELEKSLTAYQNALALDPSFAQAREYLGETYLALGNLDKATAEHKFLADMHSPFADTLARSIDIFKLNEVNQKLNK